MQRVLRGGKTVEFQDPLPDRQSWIQKNLSKMQAKFQAKVEANLIKVANKHRQSGETINKEENMWQRRSKYSNKQFTYSWQ